MELSFHILAKCFQPIFEPKVSYTPLDGLGQQVDKVLLGVCLGVAMISLMNIV